MCAQAPRCRDLAQATVDIIIKTRCSVLLWPPDRLADGTVVKPPHPLRHLLDDTVPEEERPIFKPKHQPELLVIDGPWRGRGPRYTFRERDGELGHEGWEPAMMPLRMPMLRRSMSEMLSGGEAAKERLHRALTRTATLAATRTGLLHGYGTDHDGGDDDGSPDAAPVRRAPAPWGTGAAAGGGGGAMTATEAAAAAVAAVDEEEERTTWPPRAGPAPWLRRGPRAQIQEAMKAMGAIAEDGEATDLPLPAPRGNTAASGKAGGVSLPSAGPAGAGAAAAAVAAVAAARPGSSAGPRRSNSGNTPHLAASGAAASHGTASGTEGGAAGDQGAALPLQRQGSQTAPARQHWAALQQQVLGGQGAGGAGLPAVVGKGGVTAKPVFAAFGRTLPSSFGTLPQIGASESMRSRRSFNSQGSASSTNAPAAAAAAAAVAAEEQRAQDEAKRAHLTPHRALPLGAGPVLAAA